MATVRIEGHNRLFFLKYDYYKTYVDGEYVGQTLTRWGGRRIAKKCLFPRPKVVIVDEYELNDEGVRVK